jgi:hypothetical protein
VGSEGSSESPMPMKPTVTGVPLARCAGPSAATAAFVGATGSALVGALPHAVRLIATSKRIVPDARVVVDMGILGLVGLAGRAEFTHRRCRTT